MRTARKKQRRTKVEAVRYLVMMRRTATGYSVDVPDLPGCVAVARTIRGARRLIAEAIGLHLDLMCKSGEEVRPPRRSIKFAVDSSSEEEICTWIEVLVPEVC